MYVFFEQDGTIAFTADGDDSLVSGRNDWIEVETRNLGDLACWRVQNGNLVFSDTQPMKRTAIERINAVIGEARKKIITAIPGQEMIYMRKEEEGKRYLTLQTDPENLNDFPLIKAEIGITAPTAYQIAQIWVFMSSVLVSTAAYMESVRLGSIDKVNVATSFDEIEDAVANCILLSEAF